MSEQDNGYWKENIRNLKILLSIWFVVSFLLSVIFVDQLDVIRIGGFKLGFWMAQQGSIYVYVVLIFVYLKMMDKLDHKYHHDEKDILAEESRNNE
ncbi:MAG: putative solute:sodium symporter small subunit [Pseudohongiellaceae bacterium]|jgi:putative solute:sodium symporter small subunit